MHSLRACVGCSAQEAAERSVQYMEERTGEYQGGVICVKPQRATQTTTHTTEPTGTGTGRGTGRGEVGHQSSTNNARVADVGIHWDTRVMSWAYACEHTLHYAAAANEHFLEDIVDP